ncbi:MAG: 23S rRNA (guanosine(2251)-2'-O)-methyltransferase RlmB [Paludibacteraceae bacterium]|nr:23S rRNA (guanosine(2251)-2'-O)-methyltransferase RlmB [Paludibacteraceae bacterium]
MFYKSTNPTPDTTSSRTYNRSHNRAYAQQRPKQKEMIFGLHAVIEAIDAGKTLDKVLIRRDMSSALARQLLDRLQANQALASTQVQRVPVERLNQFTDKNHQGVIAFLSPIEFYSVEEVVTEVFERGETPLIMVLDGVTDVRNFGAIARTASCAGAHALVISTKGSAAITGDAVKTSAGALHTLPVCKTDSLAQTLQYLKEAGLTLVAATEHTDLLYTQTDMTRPLAIVMGNEEKGIYEKNLEICDVKVRIPMAGTIESLNVSVAAGIMMYEALRQRNNG